MAMTRTSNARSRRVRASAETARGDPVRNDHCRRRSPSSLRSGSTSQSSRPGSAGVSTRRTSSATRRVVLLTNVGLEHTDVLGETTEEIAREKLAVAHVKSIVVLSDNEYGDLVPGRRLVVGGARDAAEAFAGHPAGPGRGVSLPGRLERRPGRARATGRTMPTAPAGWSSGCPPACTLCVSTSSPTRTRRRCFVRSRAGAGRRRDAIVQRPCAARRGPRRSRRDRSSITSRPSHDPAAARRTGARVRRTRARRPGSLYLLADLERRERGLLVAGADSVFVVALAVLVAIVGGAFAVGYIVGKLIL